jgi:hypothetical protein
MAKRKARSQIDNFINFVILFPNKFLFNNGAMLLFHVNDLCVLKEN